MTAAAVDPIHSACSASELTIPLPTDDPQSGNNLPTQANTATLDLFVSRNDTLKAEILWTLHTVTQHCVFTSNDDVSKLFPIMFPDSGIAKVVTLINCMKTNICAYVVFCRP